MRCWFTDDRAVDEALRTRTTPVRTSSPAGDRVALPVAADNDCPHRPRPHREGRPAECGDVERRASGRVCRPLRPSGRCRRRSRSRSLDRQLADVGCREIQIDAPELESVYADEMNREYWHPARHRSAPVHARRQRASSGGSATWISGCHKRAERVQAQRYMSWIAQGEYEEFSRGVSRRAGAFDICRLKCDDARSCGCAPLGNLPHEKLASVETQR